MKTLAERLLPDGAPDDQVLQAFLDHVADAGLTLYPAQEEAILEIADDKNVILATPTGSGKSLVATALHFFAMQRRLRSFYTCPIKALVSEKFFALCREFGADNVGMLTGDAAVNHEAPIICCTAEILMNLALREGKNAPVDCVVMDEFHYYADRDRGVAWQVPLLLLRDASFLLMSATLGDTAFFEEKLTQLNGRATVTVRSNDRPVPLDFAYKETPLHETVADLVAGGKVPVYIVNFTQRSCAEEAQNLMSVDFCTKDEKRAIAAAVEASGVRFDSPYGKDVSRFVRHGIGLHHAGLLPKYRLLVEKLAQKGHLKVISGTDTLGVGVNIPIRTVLFTKLCKFDGEKTGLLRVRDFQQIAGRAGRRGFDVAGSVVAQAPEHVIENLRLEAKAGNDPVKKKRIVRKKPPDRGYVHWDKAVFDRLVTSPPEKLESRFQVTHGMLLEVLQRPGDEGGGCMGMARLVKSSHERPAQQRIFGRTAFQMYKSLLEAAIVERRAEDGRVVVNADLQEDFSLNHALSLWLVDTVGKLDPDEPTYAVDVLTLAESILENPELVLQKQLDRIKTEKMAEMKMAGVEYEERIAELDKLEYPKPLRELVYGTFNEFAKKHPWVGQDNIRPKSVAREMFERFMSFGEYVREYELGRAEGLLLRYLSDVYKVLVQTVPARAKDDAFDDIVVFFRAMVKQVDSSLLDEWDRMRDPSYRAGTPPAADAALAVEPEGSRDVTRDERGFAVLVRNEVFQLVKELARKDYDAASTRLQPGPSGKELAQALAPFYEERAAIRTDPGARAPACTRVDRGPEGAGGAVAWTVEQTLLDDAGHDDWVIVCKIDLARARAEGRPVLELVRIGT